MEEKKFTQSKQPLKSRIDVALEGFEHSLVKVDTRTKVLRALLGVAILVFGYLGLQGLRLLKIVSILFLVLAVTILIISFYNKRPSSSGLPK